MPRWRGDDDKMTPSAVLILFPFDEKDDVNVDVDVNIDLSLAEPPAGTDVERYCLAMVLFTPSAPMSRWTRSVVPRCCVHIGKGSNLKLFEEGKVKH